MAVHRTGENSLPETIMTQFADEWVKWGDSLIWIDIWLLWTSVCIIGYLMTMRCIVLCQIVSSVWDAYYWPLLLTLNSIGCVVQLYLAISVVIVRNTRDTIACCGNCWLNKTFKAGTVRAWFWPLQCSKNDLFICAVIIQNGTRYPGCHKFY